MKYSIVKTIQEHIEELAFTMRPADVRECWAAAHYSPLDALKHSMYFTAHPWSGMVDGHVMAIWGVAKHSFLAKEGIPWMLTSNLVDKHTKEFLKQSKGLLETMLAESSMLINMVDKRNKQSIRWLKWMGFEIGEAVPFGAEQLPFHPFSMER